MTPLQSVIASCVMGVRVRAMVALSRYAKLGSMEEISFVGWTIVLENTRCVVSFGL